MVPGVLPLHSGLRSSGAWVGSPVCWYYERGPWRGGSVRDSLFEIFDAEYSVRW